MDIENLTIKQAREIAKLFGTAAQAPSPLTQFIGKFVVVRDHRAGVYFGVASETQGSTITLKGGARQAHYWEKGGSVPSLAINGPSGNGSRITGESHGPVVLMDVVQVCECAPKAVLQLATMPAWGGK